MRILSYVAIAGALSTSAVLHAATAISAGSLRCEDRIDPLGVDIAKPRFSWKIDSDQRGQAQTAYEVVIDGVWDSGKVNSSESLHVEYGGPALATAKGYTWKVRVWGANGEASDWSSPAGFSTGMSAWSAKWIGREEIANAAVFGTAQWIWYPEGSPAASAPVATRYFRKTVTLTEKPLRASCMLAADNGYQLTVNGTTVGQGSDFSHPDEFDISALLNVGDNTIAITANNIGASANPAGMIARLRAEFAASPALDVGTSSQWQASKDGTSWVTATALGNYGMSPWGSLNTRPLPATYLRKDFTADAGKTATRATAYVCGLGFFNLFLNGQQVSDHVMDPALSDYAKAAYYVTFDVTGQINAGANALGVALGNGRFLAPRFQSPAVTTTYGFPKLLLQLEIEYDDGSKSTIVSDETWKLTNQGPIRTNNEYDGETYDARMEMPGWNAAGFDASAWETAKVVAAPGGVLKSQMIEPMRVTQVLKPVAVTSPKPGTFIIDMGQSFYGAVRIKATGPAGTTVNMTEAYSLLADGTLKTADNRGALCRDTYIMKGGGGEEVWNPRFRGQGFRRVQVTGFPGVPTVDNFEGLVIHTDSLAVGEFECSDALTNQIHSALKWGMRSFLRSAPLDPDRDERQAWMGDPAKDAESDAYNYNVAPFYTKWMDDVERSQRSDGTIPDVATYWTWGDGVEWASVFTVIPDWFATFYDDRRVADSHYAAMKSWVLAMQQRHLQPDGTLKATSYGDWCDTSTMDMGGAANSTVTPGELVSTAYHYNNCRILQRLAEARGATADQQTFTTMADALKTAFNARFFNATTNTYQGDSQCGYVLAIKFGLVPDGKLDAVVAKLADNILVKNNGHLTVGLIGMQWLMQTLTDVGRPDLAWTIVSQTTRPGWGYMLSKGSTTIWERWDGDTQDPTMNSENLLILAGNLDAWFYQSLAGIRPGSPGFKTVLIKPEIVGNLSWAKAHFDSPYGRIASDWEIAAPGQLALNCTIPPNTTALVHVPLTTLAHATISEGGTQIWSDGSFTGATGSGITYDGADAKSARFLVTSGTYAFTATGTPVVPPVVVSPVVVDDDSAQFTGSWTRETTTEATQRFGPGFHYAAAGNGSSKADFRPALPAAGSYKVYAWWTTHTNRATNTPFTIHSADGDTTVAVNQELNGGTWNLLGTFNFKAGTSGYVTLTNAANEYVIADALKFEPVILLSSYDSWIQDLYPGRHDPAVIGADADPDHDGISNLVEFALNGSPKDSTSRGLTASLRAGDATFEFVIAARRGAVFTAGADGSQTAMISDPPIVYSVEGSQDLSFQDGSVTHVSTANTAPAGTTLPDLTTSAWEYHVFRLTGSAGLPGKGFFRARIGTP